MSWLDGITRLHADLPAALAGSIDVAFYLAGLAIWYGLFGPAPIERRVRQISRQRAGGRPAGAAPRRAGPGRAMRTSVVQRLARRIRQHGQHHRLIDRLAQAGIRSRDALVGYLCAKGLLAIGAVLGAALVTGRLAADRLPDGVAMLLPPVAGLLGFFAADLYVANIATKRRQALDRALPDGLDLLVICAEAGLSLQAALQRVANELGRAAPELADELSLTAVELGFLSDRRQALANLGRRANLASMRGVVSTLQQTERYGTPLAHSLRVLSGEFREQRMLKAEAKAARLPATLTVPMIVFILPVLFVVLLGPAIIKVMDTMGT